MLSYAGLVSCLVSNYWGPNTLFIFLVASVPLIIVHYQQFPSPMFVVPKRRSQRAMTTLSLLLEIPPFIGPTSSLLVNNISHDRYVTSSCRISRPLIHTFLTLTFYPIIIGSAGPSSLCSIVPHNPFTNTLFHALLIGSAVPSSRLYLLNLIYHNS